MLFRSSKIFRGLRRPHNIFYGSLRRLQFFLWEPAAPPKFFYGSLRRPQIFFYGSLRRLQKIYGSLRRLKPKKERRAKKKSLRPVAPESKNTERKEPRFFGALGEVRRPCAYNHPLSNTRSRLSTIIRISGSAAYFQDSCYWWYCY